MSADGDATWQRRDAGLGLLFLVAGALVTTFAYTATRNDLPGIAGALGSIGGVLGWIAGPLLLLVGANALFRSLRAGRR